MEQSEFQENAPESLENSETLAIKKNVFGFPLTFGKINKTTKTLVDKRISKDSSHDKNIAKILCNAIKEQPENVTLGIQGKQSNSVTIAQEKSLNKQSAPNIVDDIPEYFIPKQCSFGFHAHNRSVTSMSLNPKSTILVSGGHDGEVKFWDFNGMNCKPSPFRCLHPVANHSIRALSFSLSGSHILCAPGDAICRIYDMDGNNCQETVKGDMYVRDSAKTKGHTHALTYCCWHPFDREKFLTASKDGTVRIFDINSKPYGVDQALPHLHLMKAVDKRNLNSTGQCRVTCAAFAEYSAKFVVAGCSDGSLQLWNERKAYGKPDKVLRNAHQSETEISHVQVLQDEVRLLSRGLDGAMKLWDIRQFKEPVHVWENLEKDISGLSFCTDSNESMVVSMASSENNHTNLQIFDINTGKSLDVIPFEPLSTNPSQEIKKLNGIKVLWPESINQIIVSCNDGSVRFFFDPVYSKKGALSFAYQPTAEHKKQPLEGFQAPIFTMDTLPKGYKETRFGKICRVRSRDNEGKTNLFTEKKKIKSAIPPAEFFSEKKEETKPKIAPFCEIAKEDPVESIRAYAEKAALEPIFTGQAYKDAQPVPILDYSMETGDDEKLVSLSNKCPRCGLKLCQCGYMKLKKNIG